MAAPEPSDPTTAKLRHSNTPETQENKPKSYFMKMTEKTKNSFKEVEEKTKKNLKQSINPLKKAKKTKKNQPYR